MFSSTSFKQTSFSPTSWKFLDGPEPPPLSRQWRVRHLGLGVGLIYLPPPIPVLA